MHCFFSSGLASGSVDFTAVKEFCTVSRQLMGAFAKFRSVGLVVACIKNRNAVQVSDNVGQLASVWG